MFNGRNFIGARYQNKILYSYVQPYSVAIGNDIILMDDNTRPYRAVLVVNNLENEDLQRMKSPDLSPIEHV